MTGGWKGWPAGVAEGREADSAHSWLPSTVTPPHSDFPAQRPPAGAGYGTPGRNHSVIAGT
jgi:hypothetical protein